MIGGKSGDANRYDIRENKGGFNDDYESEPELDQITKNEDAHIQNLIKEAAAVKGKTINASDDEDDEEKKFNQDNKVGD